MFTPVKHDTSISSLTPVRFAAESPKPKAGDSQSLRIRLDVIVKTLLDNYAKWELAQTRGRSLCTSIEAVKTRRLEQQTKEPTSSLFPAELKAYCDRLLVIVRMCEDIARSAKEGLKQITALGKLFPGQGEAVYRTWRTEHFLQFVAEIAERYEQEVATKKLIAVEIAHCSDRASLVGYATLWEYPMFANEDLKLLFRFLAEEIKIKA